MRSELGYPIRLLCADTLLNLLDTMAEEAKGARVQEDVENVHRMRVASRRVRAAMSIFEDCFPAKRFNTWRKEMRKITSALGEARDTDVQILFLEELTSKADEANRAGLGLVLTWKENRRQALQGPLIDALERMETKGFATDMMDFLKEERDEVLSQGPVEICSPQTYEWAYFHVGKRIDELLGYEDCVHREDAIARHHAMRIAAKRLRYTLEAFSPVFKGGFKEELAELKRLQDLLGDLHDCDVWISDAEGIRRLLEKGQLPIPKGLTSDKIDPGILYLGEDRTTQRKDLYGKFVIIWDELKERGFLDELRRKVEAAAGQMEDLTAKAIDVIINEPGTKIAVLGDIHGNFHALQAVLKDSAKRGAKAYLNTGDMLGYGASPEAAIRLIRSVPSINVIGNYDLKTFRIHDAAERRAEKEPTSKLLSFKWAFEHISQSSREWLRALPKEVRLETAGMRILMTHGSPDSMDEHLGPDTPEKRLEEIALSADADLIITGHSHRDAYRKVKGIHFLNPGSVGRQDDGDPRASYAMLQLKPFTVKFYRVKYDVAAAAKAVEREKLPKEFALMILEGRSYDSITKGKASRKGADLEDRYQKVRKISQSYIGQDVHTDQVTRLSLILFDCLSEDMKLDAKDRFWLRCAATLHDIGWTEGRRAHHKTSLRMILEEEDLPFNETERKAIGSIARYHRKASPREGHAHYSTLSRRDKRRVEKLASVLRIADGLDCLHDGKVRSVKCELTPDKIIIHCSAKGNPEMEEREALKKGDLIQRVLSRDLELLWDVN